MARPIRMLHLEDSPRDAELVRHKLEAEGLACHITLVQSRDTFEAALTQESFDLIISDYNLPGYNGVAALKQSQAIQPDVPVILISGTVGEEQAVKCLHIGATDYLLKERLDRLVPAVQRAIQEAETRRERKKRSRRCCSASMPCARTRSARTSRSPRRGWVCRLREAPVDLVRHHGPSVRAHPGPRAENARRLLLAHPSR
jgi:DNA-binding NtrC family response regulator